jgi:hypothetical protein
MRQPLPIITMIASVLSQCVIRTTNGCSATGRVPRLGVAGTISDPRAGRLGSADATSSEKGLDGAHETVGELLLISALP